MNETRITAVPVSPEDAAKIEEALKMREEAMEQKDTNRDRDRAAHIQLLGKVNELMRRVTGVAKDATNAHFGYKFVSANAVVSAVRPHLIDLKLVTATQVLEARLEAYEKDNNKKSTRATVQLQLSIIDSESGAMIPYTAAGSGSDQDDKAVMKATTAALKYAWLMALQLGTGDDPEADASTDRPNVRAVPQDTTRTVPVQRATEQLLTSTRVTSNEDAAGELRIGPIKIQKVWDPKPGTKQPYGIIFEDGVRGPSTFDKDVATMAKNAQDGQYPVFVYYTETRKGDRTYQNATAIVEADAHPTVTEMAGGQAPDEEDYPA
jgi:hypothetical protein